MAEAILDTDAASRLQDRDRNIELIDRLSGYRLLLTFITAAELLRGGIKKSWGPRRTLELRQWISAFSVIHSNDDVVDAWAQLVAISDKTGRNISQNDAWTAACCLVGDLPLVTFNRKHFDWIDGLELIP